MKIIALSGIDGSGKTTQADLLEKYLEKQGKKVARFHAVSFSIANRKKSKSQKSKSVTKASSQKIFLRKIALLIDLYRFKKYQQKLKKNGIAFLIADRYFYDQIINILFLENKQTLTGLLKMAEKEIARPNQYFWINTNPETAIRREREIDQNIAYLKKKQQLYQTFSRHWQMRIINGDQPKEKIAEIIQGSL